MSWPLKTIRPASGARPPVIRLNTVVLPAPLGPRMPSASPFETSNERWSVTFNAPKLFETFSKERRAFMAPASSQPPVQYGIGMGLALTGISDASVLATTIRSYFHLSPFTHWPATRGVLQTFFIGPLLQSMWPTIVSSFVAMMASRSDALSVGSLARFTTSATISKIECPKPIPPCHSRPVTASYFWASSIDVAPVSEDLNGAVGVHQSSCDRPVPMSPSASIAEGTE